MKNLVVLLVSVVCISYAYADFTKEINREDFSRLTGKEIVSTMPVGTKAMISAYTHFCYGENKQLYISGVTEIEKDRSKYVDQFEITKRSSQSITLVAKTKSYKSDRKATIVDLLRTISKANKCNGNYEAGLTDEKYELIKIESINGKYSVQAIASEL